jgi:hypothetical protein
MEGPLLGSFLSRCDKGATAHRLASWSYLETVPLDALSEVVGLFFLEFLELGLGIRYIPNLGEHASLAAELNGLANGQSRTHWSYLYPSED